MKLFISWSGPTSQLIANELRKWFPLILPAVQPFITTSDIDKGAQWQGTIRDELDKSSFGMVILTRENLGSQWIAFEAGALSKHLTGRVATILFDIGHSDVKAIEYLPGDDLRTAGFPKTGRGCEQRSCSRTSQGRRSTQ